MVDREELHNTLISEPGAIRKLKQVSEGFETIVVFQDELRVTFRRRQEILDFIS